MTMDSRMAAIERAIGTLEVEVREARGDIARIDQSINGPPRDGTTIRDRLHVLEGDKAAATAAAAAVEAVKLAQRRTWGVTEKTVLFGFAVVATGSTVGRWFGLG